MHIITVGLDNEVNPLILIPERVVLRAILTLKTATALGCHKNEIIVNFRGLGTGSASQICVEGYGTLSAAMIEARKKPGALANEETIWSNAMVGAFQIFMGRNPALEKILKGKTIHVSTRLDPQTVIGQVTL